jgi:hypothetical protein
MPYVSINPGKYVPGVTLMAPEPTPAASPARALASRTNGAKSRGPKTKEGKAISRRNACKHGLCAEKEVVIPSDVAEDFATF